MAPATKDTYSVILPTFNERQNLPVVAWLLNRTFTEKCVALSRVLSLRIRCFLCLF